MVSGHMCMTFGYLSMNYASCKYYSPPRALRWRQSSGERERYEHDIQQGSENSEGIWVWYVNAIRLAIPPRSFQRKSRLSVTWLGPFAVSTSEVLDPNPFTRGGGGDLRKS